MLALDALPAPTIPVLMLGMVDRPECPVTAGTKAQAVASLLALREQMAAASEAAGTVNDAERQRTSALKAAAAEAVAAFGASVRERMA